MTDPLDGPLTAEERKKLRRLLRNWENATLMWRALMIMGGWIGALVTPIVGVLVALNQMGWWPFGKG